MGWRIGTMVVTELAVVAFVDNLMVISCRQFRDVALADIDSIEQRVERRAEVEAPPAAVADLINSERFPLQLCRIYRIDEAKTLHLINSHLLNIPYRNTKGGLNRIQSTLFSSHRRWLAFQAVETFLEPVGVGTFCFCERLKPFGQLGKSFFARGLGHAGIHLSIFVRFAFDG